MPKLTRLIFALLFLTAIAPATASAADLKVIVSGLRSDAGDVHIALYDGPDKFPDGDGMIVETEAAISNGSASHLFSTLPPGKYAIAVYHDENGNDDFDTNFIGLPLEGYAFSNDARVFLGPPSFEEAMFELFSDGSVSEIKMTY